MTRMELAADEGRLLNFGAGEEEAGAGLQQGLLFGFCVLNMADTLLVGVERETKRKPKM